MQHCLARLDSVGEPQLPVGHTIPRVPFLSRAPLLIYSIVQVY